MEKFWTLLAGWLNLNNRLHVNKDLHLHTARLILGASVLFAFFGFARAVEDRFGQKVGSFLRLITLTQFHFLFYASRPLPNTFAMALGKSLLLYLV